MHYFNFIKCFEHYFSELGTTRRNLLSAFMLIPVILFSQSTQGNVSFDKEHPKPVIRKTVASLIPKKVRGQYGFINQNTKWVIPAKFSNVGFFAEECTLLNSPNENVRLFGSSKYASVMKNGKDYRIDQDGKIVYEFKSSDRGKCNGTFQKQLYYGYSKNEKYGVVKLSGKSGIVKNFQIEPQYQLVHIMEGDDLENPMIVAVKNDKFGVVDKYNKMVVPMIYQDIKRNFSWKLSGLFEVTLDGKNYFFVDVNGNAY